MINVIRQRLRRVTISMFLSSTVPRMEAMVTDANVTMHVRALLTQLRHVHAQERELSAAELRLSMVVGPYVSLEVAYGHAIGLLKDLRLHRQLEADRFTFANHTVSLRDWLTNEEGYYLTLADLDRWYTALADLMEIIEAQAEVEEDTAYRRTQVLMRQFLIRVQALLIGLLRLHARHPA